MAVSQGLCVQHLMPPSWAGDAGAALPACETPPQSEASLRPTGPVSCERLLSGPGASFRFFILLSAFGKQRV